MRRILAVLGACLIAVTLGPTSPASASSPIQFCKIVYNPPGADRLANTQLNAEYVTIKNVTTRTRSLTGFTVRDAQNHVYKFGTFSLAAGRSVRLHTGRGRNTATDRYWGSGNYIWNNGGDKATLKNRFGTTLDTCRWTRASLGYINC